MNATSAPALEKALNINLDPKIYGTFAEIGAGQEVARFFFQAGKASQTVAKTMSAYDMAFSDEIYGKENNGRYVCESRLLKMLTKEYDLLQRRLAKTRGEGTTFFALADTVATSSTGTRVSDGWIGIRFQKAPGAAANDILLHVRLLDKYRLLQQEALGILGVNLVYAAFRAEPNHKSIVDILVSGIRKGQIAIDYLKCTGPDLGEVNEALLNLEPLRRGYGDAIMFDANGAIVSLADSVFGRPLVIERGSFRPVTVTHMDLLHRGKTQIAKDFPQDIASSDEPLAVFELTLKNLVVDGKINDEDFLQRLKCLQATNTPVIIDNFTLFYRLKRYLRQFSKKPIAIIIGAQHLPKVFDETHYKDLEGRLLEGMGKLLGKMTKLYVYPHKTAESCATSRTFAPPPEIKHIYDHFVKGNMIVDLAGCDDIEEFIHSNQVLELLLNQKKEWTAMVPPEVRKVVEKNSLRFG